MMYLPLFFCEVMNLWPVIVPRLHFGSFKLLFEPSILWAFQSREMNIRATFNYRLTFTEDGKMAIMAIVSPQLPNNCSYDHIFAISNKETTFTWCGKNNAILRVVHIYVGSDVKNKISSLFTKIDVELLSFQRIYSLHSKLILLLLKKIIFWVKRLFFNWWR